MEPGLAAKKHTTMKLKITRTSTEEVEISLPTYRKDRYGFYKVYESESDGARSITVGSQIIADLIHTSEIEKEECTPAEFYEAFAATMQRLKDISGIEILPLDDNDDGRFNADEASEVKEKNDWGSQMDGIR